MKIELTDREAVVLRLALRFAAPQLAALNTTFADIWPGVVLVPPGDDEEQAVTPQEVGGLLCKLDGMVGVLAIEDYTTVCGNQG